MYDPSFSRSRIGSRWLGACLALCLVAACAQPPPDETDAAASLSGAVTYLPRIALPPDAVVHVWLEEVSRADAPAVTLAEQTVPADGRQVPLPFTLVYDPGRIDSTRHYAVRAEIRDAAGNLRWITDARQPVLTHGAPTDSVTIRVVQRTPDASASEQMEPQETGAAVWEEARRRGVDFRATGNEPGWYLEIYDGERMHFVYAYGEQEVTTPVPVPTTEAGRTVYHAQAEAHDLTVMLEDTACTDSMSGAAFPTTVSVTLDGETYRGCGRDLSGD